MRTHVLDRRVVVLCLAAAASNLTSLTPGFIHDDHRIIEQNELIRDPSRVPEIASRGYWSVGSTSVRNLYRPVTILSFALNHAVGGLQPFGYRLANLLLHILVTLMVFALARRLMGPEPRSAIDPALLAGLLYAVHPVHTEVLGLVVGRAELLAAAGALGCVLAFLRARDEREAPTKGGRVLWYALSLICIVVGFLAKENAVVAPLLALAADRLIVRRRTAWGFHATAWIVLAVLLGVRFTVLGGLIPGGSIHPVDNPIAHAPFLVAKLTALKVLGNYALLLLAPARLAIDYSLNAVPLARGILEPCVVLGAGLVLGCGAAVAVFWRRAPAIAFAVIWMAIAIAPVANLFLPIGTIMAERLLYLPSVGFTLLAAVVVQGATRRWVAGREGDRPARGRVARILVAVLILGLGARSLARLAEWRDDLTVFRASLRVAPDSVRALFNYGAACESRGEDDEAERAYLKAIAIWPALPRTQYNLAGVYARRGAWEDAIRHYREALRHEPANPQYLVNLGRSLNGGGAHEEARAVLERALDVEPTSAQAYTNLGGAHLGLDDPRAAVEAFAQAARLDPANADYQRNLALALGRAGEQERAAAAYRRGLELRPADPELHAGLGMLLLEAGEPAGARDALQRAVRIRPGHPVYRYHLGRSLRALGRPTEAAAQYRQAIRIAPDSAVPHEALGLLLYETGDLQGAREHLQRAADLDPSGEGLGRGTLEILRRLGGAGGARP